MLSNERHQKIAELLEKNGHVTVADMVKLFNVSEMTIRRDFDILEAQGVLRRVHGGAVSDRGRSYEPPFISRSVENLTEKQRIGKAAAALINNGDSISLDVGTTTLEIAKNIKEKQDLTVITPSLHIASELIDHHGIRLILTGGFLRHGELSMVGYLAERVFSEFYVDKLFLGAGGVDLKAGLTEFNIEDTLVKRAMVESAKEVVLVVDSTKFRSIALGSIVPLTRIHTIVTDKNLDPDIQEELETMGLKLIIT